MMRIAQKIRKKSRIRVENKNLSNSIIEELKVFNVDRREFNIK